MNLWNHMYLLRIDTCCSYLLIYNKIYVWDHLYPTSTLHYMTMMDNCMNTLHHQIYPRNSQ